jgi:hypothetical protein
MALAGQAMSLDDGFAVASNASPNEIETVISPMQDAGGTSDAMRVPRTGRGTDAADTHAPADNAPTRGAHPAPATAADSPSSHAHKGHGRAWQSLLPGAMK